MSEEQDRKTRRVFAKLDKELMPALKAVLKNDDGMARLLSISDEEWQAAVDAETSENAP